MLDPSQLIGGTGGKQRPQPPSPGSGGGGGRSQPAEGFQAAERAAGQPGRAGVGPAEGTTEGKQGDKPPSGLEGLPEELRSIPDRSEGDEEKDDKSLGHEDFLDLMMTQLKNQDPMNPQDPKQMMGQLAQFTTASGIEKLQSDFESFFDHMRSDQSLRAAQLVGQEVMTESNEAHLPEEGEMEAMLQLERSTSSLTVEVTDGSGEKVYQEQLGEMEKGEHTYTWDGTTRDGERVPAGKYQINAYAEDGERREAVTTLVGAPVTSVAVGKEGQPPELSVEGLGEISLSDVKRIR